MTFDRGIIVRPAAGETLRVLLDSSGSDDALSVVEMTLQVGSGGPPLHLHPTHAEGFYVLAGELTVQLGDEITTGGPGTWACAPKNTPHTLANLGDEDVRLLCLFAPAGFERRFQRMLADPTTAEAMARTEAEHQTQLLGPPLTR
ncbi:cupin domain-containing protein [Kribbella shirazensis]|jgi:quercetin dioxygenase-like cupin family protein|uniref:Quercetin dioxygenase-like cupin family protein n=1 Tax=Kribbella shirazensis TaxID=1105143 RepID=A0A7X5VBU5_9ACTN|nr:cupin domain-containing protein [Kribbella shirazensis]NIK58330.1 quercetin dioxygenase-like cupin family protein [Kribbella shirazensis]